MLLLASLGARAGTNLSAWAFPGPSGRVLAQPDAFGNRTLDYSKVGYQNGGVPIPDVPVKVTISPVAGDDGASIQAAINTVKAMPLDTNGFRGAVLLTAGEYEIAGSITIDASGVVLRGAGDGTSGTILRAVGTGQRSLVKVTGSGSASTVGGTTHNITDHYVPVGARSFNVDSTSGLAAGHRVFVRRIATDQWIQDLGMDLLGPASGGAADVVPWTADGYHLDYDRIITRIEGSRITLDAPITCAIEARYAGGTIRRFTWSGRINNVGIEDLRGESDYVAADDEDHGWIFVQFNSVENAWARRVTAQHFGYACVALLGGTRTTTVQDCRSLDPVSIITGGRRYAFVMDDAQLCLVQNCYTLKDRHQFVTQSKTMGPNVFVDGLSDTAYSDAGPHHRWGTGAIWDCVQVNGNSLNVQNRGNSGTGHGWAGANEVVWNSKANSFIVQNPPTARNWLIGSVGTIQNGTMYVGPHDPGTYDSHGTNVFPNSLYYAQLQDRLAAPNLQTREYWVGDIDQFVPGTPGGDAVPVDAPWLSAVQGAAGASPVNGFDVVTSNQWVPFTFTFSLSTTDRLAGATLALAMRAGGGDPAAQALILGSLANSNSFASLGWSPVGTGSNTSIRLLDLGSRLNLLAGGKLNLAVAADVGIDWAMLELHVAPVQTLYTNGLEPVADASVRGGVNAGINYGTNATLEVKSDSSADNQRQAYLRWNLSGYRQPVHARVRLTPVSVATNGLEHGITVASDSTWSESTILWNNQPGGGRRFATWLPATDVPLEFVVTPQVQAALAGDGRLALELFSLSNVGAPGLVTYASREHVNPALRPQLLLVFSNPVPFISVIGDQFMEMNTATEPLPFTIGDPVHAVDLLTLGATSSDPALVPPAGLVLGGSSSNRTLTVTPAAGQTGTVFVTVTVTNPLGQTAGSQFALSVTNSSVPNLPASGNWSVDASGRWTDPGNWSGGIIATGADQTATFAVDVTANRFINNDSPRTLGNLLFSDSDPVTEAGWIITNSPLTLQVSSGTPTVTVSNGTATLGTVLGGGQGLAKQGEGTLALSGANTYTGTTTIGAGAVLAASDLAFGSAANSTTIQNPPTARVELLGDITLMEPFTVSCKQSASGNIPAFVNVSGTNTLAGTLSLTTGGSFWTFEAAGGKLRITGNTTNTTTTNVRTIWLRGAAEGEWLIPIGDSAADLSTAVRKDDAGTWTLAGDNTYTGNTVVSNGLLFVEGVIAGGSVTVAGGVLGGTGTIKAPVTVNAGATLSPGTSIGTLTVSNTLTLSAGSTTFMEIDAQSLTSDHVRGLAAVAYDGTLAVSNVAGALAGGQVFQLFSSGSFSGVFSSLSPASPGPNLEWSFNPADGTLSVRSLAPPQITGFSLDADSTFTLSGTGPAGQDYRVLSATNVVLPLSDWTTVATGVFVGGTFAFTDLEATNHAQRFYRVATP
jgi:autotransporter-associated beta strand protein